MLGCTGSGGEVCTILIPSVTASMLDSGSDDETGETELLTPSIIGPANCPTELLSTISSLSSSTSESSSRIPKSSDSNLASPFTADIGDRAGKSNRATMRTVCECPVLGDLLISLTASLLMFAPPRGALKGIALHESIIERYRVLVFSRERLIQLSRNGGILS